MAKVAADFVVQVLVDKLAIGLLIIMLVLTYDLKGI